MLGGGGGGASVPCGRHHCVGIKFCLPEVVKLQLQCHMQNTILDLSQTTGSIHFLERGRVPISWSNRKTGGKNENNNPVRK